MQREVGHESRTSSFEVFAAARDACVELVSATHVLAMSAALRDGDIERSK